MHEPLADVPEVPFAFDGAADLLRAWAAGLTPDPDLTVSVWADRHRILSPRGASEAGPWRTSRTPYLREIMDALSPRYPAQRVVFMKGSQVGATEAAANWIGYVVHHAPGPMLAVQPSVELAKRFSQQRIDPLIEESPALREKVAPARSRDSGNTVLSKEFPGGILVMTGANDAREPCDSAHCTDSPSIGQFSIMSRELPHYRQEARPAALTAMSADHMSRILISAEPSTAFLIISYWTTPRVVAY